MSQLVKIGNRIINLSQIVFAHYDDDGKNKSLRLIIERPMTGPPAMPSRAPNLNMIFGGDDAEFVWKKLESIADEWVMPNAQTNKPWPTPIA